jgi:hypothetical protein
MSLSKTAIGLLAVRAPAGTMASLFSEGIEDGMRRNPPRRVSLDDVAAKAREAARAVIALASREMTCDEAALVRVPVPSYLTVRRNTQT